MMMPCVASVFYFVIWPGSVIAAALYSATKVFTVAWPLIALRFLEGGRWNWRDMVARRHLSALPLGGLTGLLLGGVILLLYAFSPLGEGARQAADDVQAKVARIGLGTPGRFLAAALFLSFLHSLIEEFFWRWYVFGRLARFTAWGVACLLASLAFAAHHYVVLSTLFPASETFLFGTGVAFGGAVWCWLYRRQGSVAGCWVSHALVDIAIFWAGYRLLFR
jgi:hypothetical protein